MYKKFDISHCTQKEINVLNQFKRDNSDKISPTVYYVTCVGGMGFSLIATFDKPKIVNGTYDFGNHIDITDYDIRIHEM